MQLYVSKKAKKVQNKYNSFMFLEKKFSIYQKGKKIYSVIKILLIMHVGANDKLSLICAQCKFYWYVKAKMDLLCGRKQSARGNLKIGKSYVVCDSIIILKKGILTIGN